MWQTKANPKNSRIQITVVLPSWVTGLWPISLLIMVVILSVQLLALYIFSNQMVSIFGLTANCLLGVLAIFSILVDPSL
jgi:hypothetical protein